MPKPRPSELETKVLGLLWEHGPSTVREVLASLSDGKNRAYTTVLTVMQGMEKKGLVSHTRSGLAHVYHPQVTRDEVVSSLHEKDAAEYVWRRSVPGGAGSDR